MAERILIVGFGYSGMRFVRVLRFLGSRSSRHTEIVGICDIDPDARSCAAEVVPAFADLGEAIRTTRPTVIVVTVNESAHAAVLHGIAAFGPVRVLCEKPMTATLAEAFALPESVRESHLTVNFVERHSPTLESFSTWAAERPNLRPTRVEFFWGKHRIADTRPTIGVLSELAHPLDLVDCLFGIDSLRIVQAHGIASDFARGPAPVMDSMSLVADAGRYLLAGSSSFVWPRRHRTITAVLVDDEDRWFRATFDFDTPRWDCDNLVVNRIDPSNGRLEVELEYAATNESYPNELRGVAKVARFVECSLQDRPSSVAGYDQALKIQTLLQEIADHIDVVGMTNANLRRSAKLAAGEHV